MSLPIRLKLARETLGFTQKEMAAACTVSVQMWQGYEAGRSVPGGKVFEALSWMGINTNWLLTGGGEVKSSDEGDDFTAKRFKTMRGNLSIKEFVQKLRLRGDIDVWVKKIESIERGREAPSWGLLQVLFNELDINPIWLFGFDGPMLRSSLKSLLNTDILRNVLKEGEIYESINPGSLSVDKKAELLTELYKRRVTTEER